MKYDENIVMVIDDDPFMGNLLKGMLRVIGFEQILLHTSPSNALSIIIKTKIDLVLCDYEMPIVTGLQLIKIIRGLDKERCLAVALSNRSVPAVVVTAHASQQIITSAMNAGATGVLVKPTSVKALKDKIDGIFLKSMQNT